MRSALRKRAAEVRQGKLDVYHRDPAGVEAIIDGYLRPMQARCSISQSPSFQTLQSAVRPERRSHANVFRVCASRCDKGGSRERAITRSMKHQIVMQLVCKAPLSADSAGKSSSVQPAVAAVGMIPVVRNAACI